MADDTNSDTLLHFKRRITETDDNQETTLDQETSNALSTQHNLHDIISVSKYDREIVDTVTPGRFVSDSANNSLSKKVKWSPELDSDRKKGLFEYVTPGISEKDLGFDKKEELKDVVKDEVGFSTVGEISGNCSIVAEDNKSDIDVQMYSFVQEYTQGLAFSSTSSVADENRGLVVKEMGFGGFAEGPEIETQLVNLTDFEGSGEILGDDTIKGVDGPVRCSLKIEAMGLLDDDNVVGLKGSDDSVRCSLKIEVIDDTALIESVPVSKAENGCRKEKGHVVFAKNTGKNGEKNEKQEMDGKKEKRPRRRGKCVKKGSEMNDIPNCLTHKVEASNCCEKIGNGSKKLYSRNEMEALRFMNVKEQKKKWYEVYCGLEPVVAKEYDDLLHTTNQKYIRVNFDPRQQLVKNYEASALPGLLATRGRGNYLKLYVH